MAPKTGHISEQPITLRNWAQHINWLNVTFVVFLPLIGCVSAPYVELKFPTLIWALVYYFFTGLSITAGYHRLWAHKTYSARLPLQIFLALFGGGAIQGSIRKWSREHRSHHRYTDTDKDPYSVKKGIAYSHMGWMVLKQDPKRIGHSDISDLSEDALVRWQHKHYFAVLLTMGLILPTLVAGLWGDFAGGLIYAGILRIFAVQQATFCINSLAHWLGDQPFDDRDSPRDNWITALVTLGEGYHNFHHQFPVDYRNAIEWHQWDPTKWCIYLWSKVGLAYNLKQFRANEIEKGRLQQQQKKVDQMRAKLDWGIPLSQLPVLEWDDFTDRCAKGEALIAVGGVIHDLASFIDEHPGGKRLIKGAIGRDVTAEFNGGVYNHSNAAHNLLSTTRIGVLRGGCEVEIWKRNYDSRKLGERPMMFDM
ncbi:stearic acid desaturase [Aaosphaeria arxii CBS 175.79]|uniref:Acyl-CoA desaturase n=1 Tax=Aaosphaeria arxii CBS 175.79 TaxID=1450172 RepID=A0A6A5XDT0_9PLEO|nr:stearic acid desaturase [Aaosphaeria arxii CBS 175.79]KAF2011305.1 stearic acid desaturase [Aaosphaeria arxii CBS 175.79]